jgi:hypothetical protein
MANVQWPMADISEQWKSGIVTGIAPLEAKSYRLGLELKLLEESGK